MPAHPRLTASTLGAAATTHYDTLGVRSDASLDEIRTAYRARARALHPDRFAGTSTIHRRRVEQRMQAVNEAWSVLRDPEQRRRYDRTLRPVNSATSAGTRPPFESAAPWHAPAPTAQTDDAAPADLGPLWNSVVGLMPWLVILVVLAAIFVFTAYAVHGGFDASATKPTPNTAYALGTCVHIDPGPATSSVPCTQPNDGRIINYAASFSDCPPGTRARRLVSSELVLACLGRP